MPYEKVLEACQKYHVNTIASDSSDLLGFAHYFSSLPPDTRINFRIDKIIYTCEPLPASKRAYLSSVFGSQVRFSSLYASAETGPWAVAIFPSPLGENESGDDAVDFIFDSSAMKVEVLSPSSEALSAAAKARNVPPPDKDWAPDGTTGHLVLTCLQRLKNPLVRYVSGDIGSVHDLPPSSQLLNGEGKTALKILRLRGRDQRFSFKWLGEYFEFDKLAKILSEPSWGILQWQIIITDDDQWKASHALELRILRRHTAQNEDVDAAPTKIGMGTDSQSNGFQTHGKANGAVTANKLNGVHDDDGELELDAKRAAHMVNDEELEQSLKSVFYLICKNERLFRLRYLSDIGGFERAETSRKVVRFIDRRS